MRMRLCSALLVVLAFTSSPAGAQSLPGGLEAGPHRVGFRIVTFDDASRPTMGSRVRPLRIHVWYPAAGDAGRPAAALTLGDYLQIAGPQAATHRQDLPRTMGITLTDAEWTQYTSVALTASRDVAPAAGPFPLIVGMYRAPSVVVPAEHLASHGYVVAFVERQPREVVMAEGLVREGLILGEYVRDMQVAVARLRQEPSVDPVRLGAFGFSGDGLAQTVLAMRHPDVRAVSLFEVGWLSPAQVSSYSSMPAYDPIAMRAAVFYAYSENLGRNSLEHISELTGMRYAPRSLLYLGEPRMTHLDFVTEGLVLTQTLARRETARAALTRMSQATYRYQLTFFDAHLKGDAAAMAKLSELPVPKSGGALVELTHLPAVVPALSRAELQTLIDADVTKAMARAREDLARDPRAAVFDAAWLNATGYAYIQRNLRDRALALFTLMTESYPRSANAFDSYSEALEGAGRRADALAAAEKALALLPGDTTVSAAERGPLEAALKARITRLR